MKLDKLVAKVDKYFFHNEENSYSVLRVSTIDEKIETLTGYLPKLSEDVYYEFYGKWVNHDKFGKQFSVESYTQSNKQSKEGLISYLSSNFFTGIGPVTATKIVDTLGMDAIDKILEDKSVLKQFNFSKIRIEKFYQQLSKNQTHEHILVELYGYNIAGKTAMKILNKYGIFTMEQLKENPYKLIEDIDGIGFIKADEIAKKMGIEANDYRRIRASILFAMSQYSFKNGDMYMDKKDLEKITNQVLGFDVNIDDEINTLIESQDIIKEEDKYYLHNSYITEIDVAQELRRISNYEFEKIDKEELETLIGVVEIQKNITYTEMQKRAIISAISNKMSVITGGPGTGKTTIIDGLIEVYAMYHKIKLSSEAISERISLMAPTGRAAKRMEEVLGLTATTIHRALGFGYDGIFNYNEENQMPHQLVIIDESSMIDIFLAKKLFSAINDEAQVIIVGDVDQLPSVSPGMVLKDIIESSVIPVVKLNEIHRQAKDSNIINLAIKVNEQNLDMDSLESGGDLFLRSSYPEEIKEIMVSQIKGALNQGYDIIEDIQVLIPTYKGDVGIDAVNQMLQKEFNDTTKSSISYGNNKYYENDKVIQLVNDPKNFVMNGDIGYIKRIGKNNDNKEYAIINFDGNEVYYEKNDLDQISLAYAMSIHKSQGSEYKIVILPMVRSFTHMLKKELIYTAITRAKNFLIILGDMNLLVYAANNLSEKRKTTLKERLKKIES